MHADQWIAEFGVTFDWRADGFHADASGWEHQLFTLSLATDRPGAGDPLEVSWRQGLGVESLPTPADCLPALSSDARCGEMSWSDFAGEFGYDEMEAPLSEYRTWEACKSWRDQLAEFCESLAGGDAYRKFLEIEESE